MKIIEKKSVVPLPPTTGSISDTLNVDDKTTNAYSARVIDEMNTYSTEEKVVGTYIETDGTKKPIYRKEIGFNIPSTATTSWTGEPFLTDTNIKKLLRRDAIVWDQNRYGEYNLPFIEEGKLAYLVYNSPDKVKKLGIYNQTGSLLGGGGRCIVEYTKIID